MPHHHHHHHRRRRHRRQRQQHLSGFSMSHSVSTHHILCAMSPTFVAMCTMMMMMMTTTQ